MRQDLSIRAGESLTQASIRRLLKNRPAVISGVILIFLILISILGPWLSPNDLDSVFWDYLQAPPTLEQSLFFGTDPNGRDLFVRTLFGGRVSLSVAFAATVVAFIVGVLYGAISGYVGGKTDAMMMRLVDIIYAMPFMFVIILLVVAFGRSIVLIYLALGLVEWLDMARIVRGQALVLRKREFVMSAQAMGVGHLSILRRHIIPNMIGPIIVYMTLTIPKVILIESFLSFLGLGVQEPETSWGILIAEGTAMMEIAPWMLVFPSVFLVVTIFAFNHLGDGLRDAFDPKTK